jgi:hypothetical protein
MKILLGKGYILPGANEASPRTKPRNSRAKECHPENQTVQKNISTRFPQLPTSISPHPDLFPETL